MAAVAYTTMYDEVLSDVPGVPQAVALNAIRNAVIEFCQKTDIMVVDHPAISTVALQATYPFVPPTGYVVSEIKTAWHDGIEMDPTTAADLKNEYRNWPTIEGTPLRYLKETTEGFLLFPKPPSAVASAITMKVSLKPTRASTSVEGWILEMYREEIAHGAKGKLFGMMKKPWTDNILSGFHTGMFDGGIATAKLSAARGLGKAKLRTRSQYF